MCRDEDLQTTVLLRLLSEVSQRLDHAQIQAVCREPDERPRMSPPVAFQGASNAPAHTQLQLVVEIFIATYVIFLLVGIACIGLKSLFDGVSRPGKKASRDDHLEEW